MDKQTLGSTGLTLQSLKPLKSMTYLVIKVTNYLTLNTNPAEPGCFLNLGASPLGGASGPESTEAAGKVIFRRKMTYQRKIAFRRNDRFI